MWDCVGGEPQRCGLARTDIFLLKNSSCSRRRARKARSTRISAALVVKLKIRSDLFVRKQKSEAFLLRSLHCIELFASRKAICLLKRKRATLVCVARCAASISRILSGLPVGRQGQPCIWDSRYRPPQATLLFPRVVETSTVLHAGRIFAVAPPMFPLGLILADPFASRLRRLCSHPYPAWAGRRALPATVLHLFRDGRVRTFL